MSERTELIGAALYTKLNVSGVTTYAANGVHQDLAPTATACPFLTFSYWIPQPVIKTFGNTVIAEDGEWLVKAFTDLPSNATYSPRKLGQLILTAAETAIGSSLTVTGHETWAVYRVSDIPPFQETLSNRVIYSQGFRLRVVMD
jgi:hypothetical protein